MHHHPTPPPPHVRREMTDLVPRDERALRTISTAAWCQFFQCALYLEVRCAAVRLRLWCGVVRCPAVVRCCTTHVWRTVPCKCTAKAQHLDPWLLLPLLLLLFNVCMPPPHPPTPTPPHTPHTHPPVAQATTGRHSSQFLPPHLLPLAEAQWQKRDTTTSRLQARRRRSACAST